ncbi:uncharacterized protein LOC128680257 [Plodia interpunctella]|uniref:uncharacterized protein LOC128680257 n=1 Tax=Plodia interpunctella TaxID=58824 RepID=UPI003101359F
MRLRRFLLIFFLIALTILHAVIACKSKCCRGKGKSGRGKGKSGKPMKEPLRPNDPTQCESKACPIYKHTCALKPDQRVRVIMNFSPIKMLTQLIVFLLQLMELVAQAACCGIKRRIPEHLKPCVYKEPIIEAMWPKKPKTSFS